ncbi:NAD(P)-binding protein [Trematosphaeria pertusa]|uniref:NAD(P)-binding protein n=1 Tax=Trematosphaeria pertusa TaxID=390896 RepID=A0A6A6I642_9PLEO|nr:NAD(P)-binding protein [Trematosphaeria pertusa]KAF2245699.1 NAD(P)-binding protein [Trematosphaeria pertusa]
MTFPSFSKVFIIGGTGAQGLPIVRSLVEDGKYTCRILTRDTSSERARSLQALGPNVELFEGSFTNESDLRTGYSGCDAAFVNIDGFNTGEKAEMFWAIRCYELAIEDGGIRFFVYGNLDYTYKKSGFKPEFRAGHYDGKGRIGEWILFQAADAAKKSSKAMGAALFTTGPYIEMVAAWGTPMTPSIEKNEHGEDAVTWKVPLTKEGAVAHVALDDCGPYVRWLFDHPEKANGMDLEVAVEHIQYADLARAFTKVTGRPAQFVDVDFETYWEENPLGTRADMPAGYSADITDPGTMSIKTNFTGFWHIWRNSGGNKGVIQRNYALLDEIHPKRIRTAEEWLRIEDEKGRKAGLGSLWDRVQPQNLKPILKLHEDGFKSPVAHI